MTGRGQSPTGNCHMCQRFIGPSRIFCGPCLTQRQKDRDRDWQAEQRRKKAES